MSPPPIQGVMQETKVHFLGWEDPPGGGHSNPTQYSCLESHGQRSLTGYSPWGSKELDRTERLTLGLRVVHIISVHIPLCAQAQKETVW